MLGQIEHRHPWLVGPIIASVILAMMISGIHLPESIAPDGMVLAQPPGTATPTGRPSATPTPGDLILDASRAELAGRHVFRRVILRNRARLEVSPYTGRGDAAVLELVADHIEIDRSSAIIGDEAGYRGQPRNQGEGPGGGEGGRDTFDGGAGGGYGGAGGDGVLDLAPQPGARGGRPYGTRCGPDIEMGSAGGAPGTADSAGDPGAGGAGGAAVALIADTVLISGTISVDGEDGIVSRNDAAGGGAGGGILVRAGHLEMDGRLEANGGDGGITDDGGGGGGGGRIKLHFVTGDVARGGIRANGGRGDGNGYRNDGGRGSICIAVIEPTATSTATASATPTVTPVWTSTSTPSPSATPTSSATASNTASATPTTLPTSTPAPLFMPLLLREACPSLKPTPVTVALVIDASSSMRGRTNLGRSKLDAAKDAARGVVDLVRSGGPLRVAIVRFAGTAEIVALPSDDRPMLLGAISELESTRGSRIDAGIAAGRRALAHAGLPAGSQRRLILLTDGRPAPTGPTEVRAAAAAARDEGITIDTIGIGPDVDADLLREVAGSADRYHPVEDAEELIRLLTRLVEIPDPCAGVRLWPSPRSSR